MVSRLTASALALSMFASTLPVAMAADAVTTIEAPTKIPCEGTNGKDRARCITDALKAWKELERDFNDIEDDIIAQWKADHSNMGVGSDYQKALRTFLGEMRAKRKAFQKQLNEFRKTFFQEQKAKRDEGDGRKATEVKLEKTTLEAAKAICGPEDDDGAYRLCMRQQLRKKPGNVDRRSRTSTKLLGR